MLFRHFEHGDIPPKIRKQLQQFTTDKGVRELQNVKIVLEIQPHSFDVWLTQGSNSYSNKQSQDFTMGRREIRKCFESAASSQGMNCVMG